MFLPRQRLLRQEAAVTPVLIESKPVYSWGVNFNGSLGLGDTVNRSSPVQIGTSSWIQVSAGFSTTVGITATRGLFTWGSAAAGALGNGTTLGDRSSPIAIGTSSWSSVAAGWGTNYAIRTDGGLFVWGAALSGKHGLNDNTNRNSPVQIGTSSWIQVASMNVTTAAITTDNRLFIWGLGFTLGLGNTGAANRSSPVQLLATNLSLFTQISVGESASMAIGSDGIGWHWGGVGPNAVTPGGAYAHPFKLASANYLRPIPLSTFQSETDESNYLTATGITGRSWLQAVTNPGGGLALRSDKKLYIWGQNTNGNMGVNSTNVGENFYAPQPFFLESNFNFISAGGDQGIRPRFYAIDEIGRLWSWGNNFAGSLGVGDTVNRLVPTLANTTSSFVFVAGGPFSTAAIGVDGSLFTWGQGTNGALGNSTTTGNVLSPTKIGSSSWYQVRVGHNYMNGITGTYKLFSWGLGALGTIGDGTANSRSVPTAVGSSSWVFVTAGSSSAFAIRSDNTLWAWGSNLAGNLGLGDTINRSSPVQITVPATWKFVNSMNQGTGGGLMDSFYHTYGIANDNTLYGWGPFIAGTGLIAIGGVTRSAPVQISTSAYSSVNAGICYTVAVRTNGVQYWWGRSDSSGYTPIYSQNNSVDFSTLQFVQSNWESWRFISAGSSHGAAIRSDYKLFTWGRDDWGQLGTGSSNVVRSYPVQIGSSSWTQVACGHNTTYAITTNNRLFTWGLGGAGEMGNNSVLSTSSPVQLGASSWTQVSANRSYVMALRA